MLKKSLFLLPIVLLFNCGIKPTKQEPKPLNIIFIAIDDMNNWVSCLGGQAQTPNIDALAAKGRLFTNAHCAYPACNPSRTAIMTGQRPETTGQFENQGNFRNNAGGKERITLAQFLQNRGYETVAAGKIFHSPAGKGEKPNPVSDPVSWHYQFPNNTGTSGANLYLDENGQAKWLQGALKKEVGSEKGISYWSKSCIWGITPQNKEQTADWENASFCADYLQKPHEKPFFLACGISRPHAPLIAPKAYFDKYPLDKIKLPELPDNDMDDVPDIAKTNFTSEIVGLIKEKNEYKKAVQAYLACMSFADDCVGQVLQSLEKSPYKDNTIVVLWSDHGWQLAHKNRWEKYSLWHQASHSPLIVQYPNMKNAGTSCSQSVSLMDLFPTMTDLLGIKKPDFTEGVSLLPQLQNPTKERTEPAVITYPKGSHAVVLGTWRYIHYSDNSEELYDHTTDPNEWKNVANEAKNEGIKQKLKKFIPK
jgi:arylsulfatase A-like enzyme